MNQQSAIERKALLAGALVYMTMAVCGFYTHYKSHSEAILLEGNYNLVNAFASLIGYFVVKIRHKKTETFPWGQFMYESLYALIKGVLILGILTAALWENAVKVYDYIVKGKIHEVNTDPIIYMVLLSIVLCFGLALYYKVSNKKTGNNSMMLATDTKAVMIDGYLSLFGGGSLLLMVYLGKVIPSLQFLQYIGDALVVLVFELVMIKEPIQIIKENFVEIAGGQLQSEKQWSQIEEAAMNIHTKSFKVQHVYITKTGSLVFLFVYIAKLDEYFSAEELFLYRQKMEAFLQTKYSNSSVEIVFA